MVASLAVWRAHAEAQARFNPLHCGAVVASIAESGLAAAVFVFQSPSLRGSGRFVHSQPPRRRAGRKVSIPFIAGQWSLHADEAMNYAALAARFNPLHCGAVVASGADRDLRRGGGGFQSPSLRGSGRFAAGSRAPRCEARRFNPLHCGAVVASLRSCARGWKQPPSFNPLHCGAVVASGVRFRR